MRDLDVDIHISVNIAQTLGLSQKGGTTKIYGMFGI